ncbi:hypothetical protein KR50_04320 [Jeotgalibacillus campisalis]|uniref:Uncharacterized protein n=1 Tax=Jeotgalibacillus campisalis TaxID=220754 RepID=A0A0C2WAN8_9BACL|nr:hypothetical protein KR50_04320 [Jeotgalibacillus campisalis]
MTGTEGGDSLQNAKAIKTLQGKARGELSAVPAESVHLKRREPVKDP